ncbi:single-stranded-DNA-specific exonuclease RecJ [Lactobacillus selangorensis]|nr:single-stranded-DNA-specific exonuclease RecJ [Lactobacillus selangorensis]
MQSRYQWQEVQQPSSAELKTFAEQAQISEKFAALLMERGVTDPAQVAAFLKPTLNDLNDPFQLHDMHKAVDRIQRAIMNGEKITIYGDYDADGLTSTSVMKEAIESVGGDASVYIPNRFHDGYGPNMDVYKRLIADGTQLIVTVDNGVSGKAEIAYAHSQGVDVVVTDHHELPAELPTDAAAIVHPRYPGSDYPFDDLAGVGVAFKVACALLGEIPTEMLDLVAIGTVADLVSLRQENRALVSLGLQVLRQASRTGIAALCKAADVQPDRITEETIGFALAPRLNALGRMGDATMGVTLLTTFDEDQAADLAQQIQELNTQRQDIVKEISKTALAMAATPDYQAHPTLTLAHEKWHSGVIGIVASKVVEVQHKPTIVLDIDPEKGTAKGSGRSIKGFNLYEALAPHQDEMVTFGGHAMACGLTIATDKLPNLQQWLDDAAAQQDFQPGTKPQLEIAGSLTADQVTPDLYHQIRKLAPFGTANHEPVFVFTNQSLTNVRRIGADKSHLKFQFGPQKLNAIAFRFGTAAADFDNAPETAFAGTLSENTWRGKTTLQIQVRDLKTKGTVVTDLRAGHLTRQLFEKDADYVFFNPDYYQQLKKWVPDTHQALMADDQHVAASKQLIVVDEPQDLAEFQQFLKLQQADKIGCVFYTKHSVYLEGMPQKTQYGQLLVYVRHHHDLHKAQLKQLAEYLKIDFGQLIFILQVFFELGFVKMEKDSINAVVAPQPHALDSAHSYQQREQRIKMEQTLVYSTFGDLRQWLTENLSNGEEQREGAVIKNVD